MKWLERLQATLTAVGGFLGWYVGGMDGFLYALLAFMLIDYITGVMNAILKRRLSSEIGAKGIFKKVLILALVGLGHVIDSQVLGESQTIRTAVIFFYLSNEGISILENAAAIGLPVPEQLRDVLARLNDSKEGMR